MARTRVSKKKTENGPSLWTKAKDALVASFSKTGPDSKNDFDKVKLSPQHLRTKAAILVLPQYKKFKEYVETTYGEAKGDERYHFFPHVTKGLELRLLLTRMTSTRHATSLSNVKRKLEQKRDRFNQPQGITTWILSLFGYRTTSAAIIDGMIKEIDQKIEASQIPTKRIN